MFATCGSLILLAGPFVVRRYENFVANDDSEEDEASDQYSEVDERTLHRNLIVAEAKADADNFMRSLSEGRERRGSGSAPPFRRQSSVPTPLPRPSPSRRTSASKNAAATRGAEVQNEIVDLATGRESSASGRDHSARASTRPLSSAQIELDQLVESDDQSSSGSGDTQTEQRRVVEKNRQAHRDNLYQQARAAAAAHPVRRSGGSVRGEQQKLDAFLPKHAERAARLEKIARESSTSWADDLRKVGGDSDARSTRYTAGSRIASKKASKNRKLPRVEPPRWRSGGASVDRRDAQAKDSNDRREKRSSASGSTFFMADRGRQQKRRRSAVPFDEDEESDDAAGVPQQQPDGDEDEDSNVVVRGASGGKQRRKSRRMLLDSDDDGPNSGSDSGSD